MGAVEGFMVDSTLGEFDGLALGINDGFELGTPFVGAGVKMMEGLLLGAALGVPVGLLVEMMLGAALGLPVGIFVGLFRGG